MAAPATAAHAPAPLPGSGPPARRPHRRAEASWEATALQAGTCLTVIKCISAVTAAAWRGWLPRAPSLDLLCWAPRSRPAGQLPGALHRSRLPAHLPNALPPLGAAGARLAYTRTQHPPTWGPLAPRPSLAADKHPVPAAHPPRATGKPRAERPCCAGTPPVCLWPADTSRRPPSGAGGTLVRWLGYIGGGQTRRVQVSIGIAERLHQQRSAQGPSAKAPAAASAPPPWQSAAAHRHATAVRSKSCSHASQRAGRAAAGASATAGAPHAGPGPGRPRPAQRFFRARARAAAWAGCRSAS